MKEHESQIGPYRVLSELGSGGMATVYLAQDASGRFVVLKIPRSSDADIHLLFQDEARIGIRLKHRHVVETIDYFEHYGQPVIVLEYVPGRTLSELRKAGAMPLHVVVQVGHEIALALHALHTAQDGFGTQLHIVHRDVTPANILVGQDASSRLIDLGIAKWSERQIEQTATGLIRGTLRYLAPEVFESSTYSPASDMWSLGVTLLDAALGRHAIPGSEGEIVATVVRGRATNCLEQADFPESFSRCMRHVLAYQSSDRPKNAEVLAQMFSDVATALPQATDATKAYYHSIFPEQTPLSEFESSNLLKQATAIYIPQSSEQTPFESQEVTMSQFAFADAQATIQEKIKIIDRQDRSEINKEREVSKVHDTDTLHSGVFEKVIRRPSASFWVIFSTIALVFLLALPTFFSLKSEYFDYPADESESIQLNARYASILKEIDACTNDVRYYSYLDESGELYVARLKSDIPIDAVSSWCLP